MVQLPWETVWRLLKKLERHVQKNQKQSQTRVHTIVPTALFTTAKGGSGRTHPRGAMGRPAVHLTMAHGPA